MKPKCLIPWTNINIGTLGRIDPCCKFDPSSYQEKLNIMENNVEDYLKSKMLDKVKTKVSLDFICQLILGLPAFLGCSI